MENSPLITRMSENQRLILKFVALGFCIAFLIPITIKTVGNGGYGYLVSVFGFLLAITPSMFNLNFLHGIHQKWCWTTGCLSLALIISFAGVYFIWPGFRLPIPENRIGLLSILAIGIFGNLVPFVASIVFLFKGYPKT